MGSKELPTVGRITKCRVGRKSLYLAVLLGYLHYFSSSFQSTGSIGRMELDSLQVTKVIEATASRAVTSSLAQKVDFTRFGNTVTDDYHVMLGGDAGATGGSGLRIQTFLKATSENSQNHLKYNVSTGRMEGVQNLIGTSSIATNVNYIAHSKTSSFGREIQKE